MRLIGLRTLRPSSRRCLCTITACSPLEKGRKGTKAEIRPVIGDYGSSLVRAIGDLKTEKKSKDITYSVVSEKVLLDLLR